MASMEPSGKLRFLCLHGYLQTAESFRLKTGSLRKALKQRAEFVYIDAPLLAPPLRDATDGAEDGMEDSDASAGTPGRCWWTFRDVTDSPRPSRMHHTSGWPASREAIDAALTHHAPIHGLLGFSQGAAAAALYLAERQLAEGSAGREGGAGASCERAEGAGASDNAPPPHMRAPRLRCAILASGFVPQDEDLAALLRSAAPLTLPTLHILGLADAILPPPRSRELHALFHEAALLEHGTGHRVPNASGEVKAELQQFLDRVRGTAA